MAPTRGYAERQPASHTPLRRQRLKITTACQACRLGKVKCDGDRPACSRCLRKRTTCTYSRSPVYAGQVQHEAAVDTHTPVPVSPPTSRAHSLDRQASVKPVGLEHLNETQEVGPDQGHVYTAHGQFAGDVAAAIDARTGMIPATTSNLVPFVDAPLFGELDLEPNPFTNGCALPPRQYADNLVNIYWQHIDPVEPVLCQERFFHSYEKAYSGSDSPQQANEDVRLSILYTVFALAVQRQESTPQQQRNEEGNGYFQHAWGLVRPETILWSPGSIELVQCLMLMNRYLHCTNNQQKTWITAGLAMRIAQNMCSDSDKELKERVWASCIGMDRCVSWSLGRTSAPLIPLPNRFDTKMLGFQPGSKHSEHLRLAFELHEIGNHIQLAETQTRNSLAARLGLPRLYQQDEYHTVAVQLDTCLNRWEQSLPIDLQLQTLRTLTDRKSRAEGYLLHLRLLHTRIYLHRPMLARHYTVKSHPAPVCTTPPSLSDRLLQDSATICIETARSITSLILETHDPNEPIGLLPWWYRIYYLHIAGTIFLAAMFGSDLFTTAVSQSWDQVMFALRAHEHLSTYVQQCVWTFESLSRRVLDADVPSQKGIAGSFFDDIFQEVGFDFDNYLFGGQDTFHTW
ncbi:hypothetical protein BO94DRAFT_520762 [Aspergillus sclerotioniger CBS 115572]|uniref:Zn(2)-C6 fungal-type domain-containing protein n=1 Tax=Aspergillus sclerotioniger CBS 115572 TaxID=1450535 RepID=A0A317W2U5_9EURO|nr:hypothetical protein BO94DRAFT_520762 [Aspergillus sclerotioniger CBS 115572]PWY80813.1 hypothetical protein BO94DRAFT_520762 [Aspergillus sclerotioniger CBS 115572]